MIPWKITDETLGTIKGSVTAMKVIKTSDGAFRSIKVHDLLLTEALKYAFKYGKPLSVQGTFDNHAIMLIADFKNASIILSQDNFAFAEGRVNIKTTIEEK